MKASVIAGLGFVLLACVSTFAADDTAAPKVPAWSKDVVELLRTVPILDEGRIKPLDTYASYDD